MSFAVAVSKALDRPVVSGVQSHGQQAVEGDGLTVPGSGPDLDRRVGRLQRDAEEARSQAHRGAEVVVTAVRGHAQGTVALKVPADQSGAVRGLAVSRAGQQGTWRQPAAASLVRECPDRLPVPGRLR